MKRKTNRESVDVLQFDGFERTLILEAIETHMENLEERTLAMDELGKTPIFAPGFWKTVGRDLKIKVEALSTKKEFK
tara:strand:- start:8019 stop:8249 length:231 start_codon:yes stop_codon:yes gene_type:complete